MDRADLEAWALEETEAAPACCPICDPQTETLPTEDGHLHLSKLASEILEYVLEAALIHLEVEQPPYRLTAGDIAACFGKTAGQISPALHRLRESGFLTVQGQSAVNSAILPKRVVLPTVSAMRTLDAFQGASESTIKSELAKLETV
jgi:hypothetical protein